MQIAKSHIDEYTVVYIIRFWVLYTMASYSAIKQLLFQLVLHVELLNTGVEAVNSNACVRLNLNKTSVKSNITDCTRK